MFSLKLRLILLLLVFFPIVCNAEDSGAPAKFYDGLQSKAQEIAKYCTVKKNETLFSIAARYGYDHIKLAEWNGIDAPYAVKVGQRLKLFAEKGQKEQENLDANANKKNISEVQESDLAIAKPKKSVNTTSSLKIHNKTYLVGKNESLYSIALRFKVSAAQIAAWNALPSVDLVHAGQKLNIFDKNQIDNELNSSKIQKKIAENSRDISQKSSIISINNKNMLKFYCQWPTEGKIIKNFSQTADRGIEISGKLGQAIKAIAVGRVVAVSPGIYGHGGFIVIEHNDQFLSSYANNRRSLVKNGQKVTQGQIIAEMGRVGRKPPSLEFEIRKNGKLVNPMWFLPKKYK